MEAGETFPPKTMGVAAGLFVVAFLAIHLALVLTGVSPVSRGELVDTDGYMRALRVERLLETGDWFDGTEPRSNAPFGETSHWTRPLDAILVAASLPFLPFMDLRSAVFAAAVIVPPLLTLLVYLGTAWAVLPLVGSRVALLVPLAVLAQPMVAQYSFAGRVDHHPLILLLFVLSLGCLFRALDDDVDGRAARSAGLLAGAGLWVSTEFLAPLALLFGGLAFSWIAGGEERTRAGLGFSTALLVAVGAALLLEHGGAAPSVVEFDRISLPHLLVAALAAAFWWAADTLGPGLPAPGGRAGFAGAGALVAAGAMGLVFPSFFGGPWVDVDPAVERLWLRHVRELHPLLPGRGGDLGSLLLYLGPVLVALPWLSFRVARSRRGSELPSWVLLGVGVAGFTALAVLQRRWATYAEVLAAVGLAGALDPAMRSLRRIRPSALRVAGRAVLAAGVLVGFPLLGGLLGPRPAEAGAEPSPPPCRLRPALASVDAAPEPRTILALMDFGPEILYRTPHRVVATPYHRNEGIADSHRILAASSPADAQAELQRRQIDVILLCPERDGAFFGNEGGPAREPSLYDVLVGGEPPAWLRPLAVPGDSGFLAYEMGR